MADEPGGRRRPAGWFMAPQEPNLTRRMFNAGAGDQGLITLAACQAYAKEVSTPK
ncbi:hypothetical protein PMI21_01187 [Pseudomonas sp. GM18]|nr:hypothetical protein PMI21_01187 [Pseudomonas sp. GM18]